MSERDDDQPEPLPDAILDANLERLLAHASDAERPAVPREARARILAELQARAPSPEQPAQQDPSPSSAPGSRSRPPAKLRWLTSARAAVSVPVSVAVAIAAAAILAWVLGLGHALVDLETDDPQFARHEHLALGAKSVTLTDGSQALLRTGTTLEQLGPRHLRLVAGEVLLDVHAAVEPMLVETPQGRALVLGTRILLRSDGDATLAAVVHGSARLEGSATELLLRAGEQALLHGAAAPERIAGRRLSYEIDWARELLAPDPASDPVRRGNLIARAPRWTGQVSPSPEWPLPIRELTVDVHVEDGHLRATIDQTFFNHLERDLEGVYQFPLPPEAAISRLAMYVDGKRMEAGVVERDRGRDIFEQIVHRRRDPALLEWMQGNLFQVRVFPLPARTEKRIVLSYTAALDELYGDAELRVPIPDIDLPVAKVHYRIRMVGAAGREFASTSHAFELTRDGDDLIADFSASNETIGTDIVAALAALPANSKLSHQRMLDGQARRYHAVRVRPDLLADPSDPSNAPIADATEQPARDWVVVFDSSASRTPRDLAAQREFLHAWFEQLDGNDRVAVELSDSRLRWSDTELRRVSELDLAALTEFVAGESRVGLGLSDLELALDQAVERLEAAPALAGDGRERVPTILYLGDGLVTTLGPGSPTPPVLASRFAGRTAFVAVSFGQAYDAPLLEQLAAAGDGLHVHVGEGESIPWRALELLTTLATPRILELDAELVDAEGQVIAAQHSHASRRSLADGEALELLARLEPDAPEPVALVLRGRARAARAWTQRFELEPADDDARWLPRAWARAEVAALSSAGIETNAAAITELGLEHFLVTPTTSLLVLESEAMYQNFAVHRPSEDAWARYPAPDRIEVVRELDRSEAGRGQYVTRAPIEVLGVYNGGFANVRTTGFARRSGGDQFDLRGLGGLGLIGTGRGGGGRGDETGGFGIGLGGGPKTGSGFGARGLARHASAESSLVTKQTESFGGESFGGESFGGFVGRAGNQTRWTRNPQQQALGANSYRSLASASVPFSTVVTGATIDGLAGPGLPSLPWAQALHYSGDWRLADLGELVPALFEEPFDLAREQLLITGLDGTHGSLSEPASALIRQARAAQAEVRYALPEGGTLDIDARGRFALIHQRWGCLDERIVYDGEQLHADYPQLELSVIRAVGPTSPALVSEWVPWMVPDPDHLARFYDVVATGPRTLRLSVIDSGDTPTPADERVALEVELDAQYRVVSLEVLRGVDRVSITRFEWTDRGLVLDGGRTLTRVGPASPIAATRQPTRVDLPLVSPADLSVALAELEPGSPAWIAVQQQRLAGNAALGQVHDNALILAELAEVAGRVLPGELVLAGAGLTHAAPETRKLVFDAATDGPVLEFVRASVDASAGKISAMRKLADRQELEGTPLGFWAGYWVLLYETEHNPGAASLTRLVRWLDRYQHPTFALLATLQLSNRWWSHTARKSEAWLALAKQDNHWKQLALHQAGVAHYYNGRYDDAAPVFERAFAEAERDGTLPVVDGSVMWALTTGLGEAGWELLWARLRERVAASGDARLAIGFMQIAAQIGRPDDGQLVLDRLEPDALGPDVALAVFDALVAAEHMSEAKAVLDSVRARTPDDVEVLVRVATLAELQGDLDQAATALEHALVLVLDQRGLTLDELRQGFDHLFELRARLARPIASRPDTVEAALAGALAVADRWREEDPDNAQIDLRCAELLWSLDRDDEAWRQLSSVIDRHANEGEALAWLADTLERAGQFDRAVAVWNRAIAVEPTDAHNRLRRANALLAHGDDAAAKAGYQAIVDGDWQPRFGPDVNRARRQLASLDR